MDMYDTILIPYDGSDEGRKGAEHGIDLAAALGSEVHALYVVDLPGVPRSVYLRDDEEEMRERYHEYGEEVTEEIADLADAEGLECTTAIKHGSVSETIVEYADEEELDAIVIGSAYRGKLGTLLGSTMEKVVRSATVPVVTHRMQADDL